MLMCLFTPFGLYEYIFMPFGLKNTTQSFQRLMDRLLADIPHPFVYLDNILLGTPDVASHMAGKCLKCFTLMASPSTLVSATS